MTKKKLPAEHSQKRSAQRPLKLTADVHVTDCGDVFVTVFVNNGQQMQDIPAQTVLDQQGRPLYDVERTAVGALVAAFRNSEYAQASHGYFGD